MPRTRFNNSVLGPRQATTSTSAAGIFGLTDHQVLTGAGLFPRSPDPNFVAIDPFFNSVNLLLSGDGTNGAQNNTFLDSSANNLSITRTGSVLQGTFSPFSVTGWSNYFDGTGDFLQTSIPSAIGTGNFTFEAWVYSQNVSGGNESILSINGTSGLYVQFFQTFARVWAAGLAASYIEYNGVTTGRWYHFAVTRTGSTLRMFIDGTLRASGTTSGDMPTTTVLIGTLSGGVSDLWKGNISNLRLIVGTSLYTASFTPPTTHLTAVAGTSLLTCQSNRFIDNSTNATPITRNGDVAVQKFSPFAATAAYTASTIGGAGYSSAGASNRLNAPASANFQYAGDFSVETWIYPTTSVTGPLWGTGGAGQSDQIFLNGASSIFYDLTSFNYFNSRSSVVLQSWSHICITRQSGTLRIFINGILIGTKSQSATLGSASTAPGIFTRGDASDAVGGPIYLSSLRVCNGSVPTEYQTSSTTAGASIFSPPTQPVTTTSQGATSGDVKLLLNFTNAAINDLAMNNTINTVGTAQVSTAQGKFAGSLYFDGTSYLDVILKPEHRLEKDDFTLEFFMNAIGSISNQVIIAFPHAASNYASLLVYGASATALVLYSSSAGASWDVSGGGTIGTVTAGVWHHVAITRQGSTMRLFFDGSLTTSFTFAATFSGTYDRFWIGDSAGNSNFNGYIDELRFTKGYARYTAAFTPPTSPHPAR